MLELMPMPEEIRESLCVEPGSVWEFIGPENTVRRGRYRLIGVARNVRSLQESVVLRGQHGLVSCTLTDLADKFRCVSRPATE